MKFMCGVCGILKFNAADSVDPALVEAMTEGISHRGPDDFGYHVQGQVGLGHRRLSIIDLAGGRQPMENEDGSVVVVFNGEIYNFQDIRRDLIRRGHRFRTRSDTETIVHAYEEYGDDCVKQFRGMFVFALWDQRRQRLLIVRDRLGIKPLYYYQNRDGLFFSSEVKSLTECQEVPREVDETSLNLYLSLRYVPGPRTMFKGILKLQPGYLLVADRDGVKTRQYWDITYGAPLADNEDTVRQFQNLLEESVKLRLMAEVPLGVFLSGGLDSSAILALMSKYRQGEPIKTFSVGYPGSNGEEDENCEFAFARQAAEAFGAEHHEFNVNALDFADFVPKLAWQLDEPLADPSCIPLYFISRLARQHITVVLSGEGADEILGGYTIYDKMLTLERLRKIPGAEWSAKRLAGLAPEGRYQNILEMASLPLAKRYRGISRGFRPALQARLMRQRARGNQNLDDIFAPLFRATSHTSPLNRMLYADSKVWLPDDLLLKADKMTMANALELRVPFLDHKLVEYSAQLPDSMKLNGGIGKVLLRRIMKGVLPESILHRPKKGFPVPVMAWLRGPLRDFTRQTLLVPGSACRRFFDLPVLEEIVDGQEAGVDRQQELWSLLIFEFWHRAFMRQPAPAVRKPERELVYRKAVQL
jgi:asparagine synthase (glutamine-hydrolysing)